MASLTPTPKQQIYGSDGNPLVGGKIYTYAAGTTTPLATYTDAGGLTANTNPIILNSLGQANIWLAPSASYKFSVFTSADVLLYTVDNITAPIDYLSVVTTLASPPPIGSTAPNTGAFTTLAATTATITTGNITTVNATTVNATTVTATGTITAETLTFEGGSVQLRAVSPVYVRQTVLSGPVDTNGFSAFGGSTGAATVTASGTLIATAANGSDISGNIDRVGSITNPSWTGLNTNGTMYLYLDIAANGTCTTGSTTLLPTYRWGGANVVTSGQATFNIQEMQMKVGDGSTAVQTYRVFVGEVTVGSSVVSAITWYALMGRYEAAAVAMPAASTPQVYSHNLGGNPAFYNIVGRAQVTSPVAGCLVGEVIDLFTSVGGSGINGSSRNFSAVNKTSATFVLDGSGSRVRSATNGAEIGVSSANTNLLFSMNRGNW